MVASTPVLTLEDGSPAFPERVIATLGPATAISSAIASAPRPAQSSWRAPGHYAEDSDVLVTHGPELAETEVEVVRAITGGTGDCAAASAEIRQTLLGMSDRYGVRLQVRFAESPA